MSALSEPTMREQFDSWLKTMPSINSLETQLCWVTWQACCKVRPRGSQEQVDAIESFRKDAERYRWIRDKRPQSDVCGTDDRREFDAAIDEAMKIRLLTK